MPFTRSAPLRTLQERPGPSPLTFIHPSAWKACSKKLPCENKGKANEEEAHDPAARGGDRLGRLHRPQPADGGEGKVRRLRREAARASGERVLRRRGDGGVGWHGRRPGPERDGGLRGLPPILITRGLRTSALRCSQKFGEHSEPGCGKGSFAGLALLRLTLGRVFLSTFGRITLLGMGYS